MGEDRRPWWAQCGDPGQQHHSNGNTDTPTGKKTGRRGTPPLCDHGTAPGVADSGNTITLQEWKRRQQ